MGICDTLTRLSVGRGRVLRGRLLFSLTDITITVFNLPPGVECREQVNIGPWYPAVIAFD